MQYTLLDMTQTILSSMDSDTVDSITDTPESLQVATAIRTAYYDIINRGDFKEHKSPFHLTPSNDTTKPTLMSVPADVSSVDWVRYNKITTGQTQEQWGEVKPLCNTDFLNIMFDLNTDADNVGSYLHTVDGSDIKFFYQDDRAPTYYTTFDDYTIIFDSYDSSVDSTLQASKTWCLGARTITWTMSDSFTPSLEDDKFPILLNEAKSLAWVELKQTAHPKAEQNARRSWSHSQKDRQNVRLQSDFQQLPNFGRR